MAKKLNGVTKEEALAYVDEVIKNTTNSEVLAIEELWKETIEKRWEEN